MNELTGVILKGIGGFYYVKTSEEIVTCKARGIFRKSKIIPSVGDNVKISFEDITDGVIEKILPRKNHMIRPPVSNIDKLFIVVSVEAPLPNQFIIDKTIAMAEVKNIEPIIIITKTDLGSLKGLEDIYRNIGIKTYHIDYTDADSVKLIMNELTDCISAFTGNSGVGKSTLLNKLMPKLMLETGEISKKLGRGKHTTRHVELFPVHGGYVADTPGFSTLDIERFERIYQNDLPFGFREFEKYLGTCKFSSCTHTCEKGCEILKAVEAGEIHQSRFDNYKTMFNEVKDVKEWQIQKNV